MDCTICGKATLPGAMLCVPCKAALKRARYVTVQESIRRPSVIDARRHARRARPADSRPTDSIPRPEIPPRARVSPDVIKSLPSGRRVLVMLLGVIGALVAAAYFGHGELGANGQGDVPTQASADAHPPKAQSSAKPAPPAVEPAAVVVAPPVATAAVAPAGSAADSEKRPDKPAAKRTMLAARATFATADGDPPDAVAPPPEPEKPAPVPAPPPPRPVPDRWQNMRDALAECDRLGIFDGLICGQRVRIQYCEGYWGKVSQCPGANTGYER